MIVSGWTRIEILAMRSAMRASQKEFGDLLGYSVHTVQRWEHLKPGHALRGKSATDLDEQLERLDERQRQRFEAAVANAYAAMPASGGFDVDDGDDVNRRQFGMLGAAVGAMWSVPGSGIRADVVRFGVGDARALMAAVDRMGAEEQRVGGVSLVDEALAGVAKAQAMLDGCVYDEQAGREFRIATGNLACLAGWTAFDADVHPIARSAYNEALALAAEADDPDLTAHVCLNIALQLVSLSRVGRARPQRALAMVERARDLMRGRPPGRIHALIATREAMAHAVSGDRAAFARSMATAWRELDYAVDQEPVDECPRWLRFVTPAETLHQESRGLGDLGDLNRSARLSEDAVVEVAGTRNAAFYQAWAAVTQVRIGEVDAALTGGLSVLNEMSTKSVGSTRTLKALEPVRTSARGSIGERFARQFDTLSKAVTLP